MGIEYGDGIIRTVELEAEMKVLELRHREGRVRKRSREVCGKTCGGTLDEFYKVLCIHLLAVFVVSAGCDKLRVRMISWIDVRVSEKRAAKFSHSVKLLEGGENKWGTSERPKFSIDKDHRFYFTC